jgi:predicted transcriptional regulator of viral defense system
MIGRNKKDFLVFFTEDLQSKGQYWFCHEDINIALSIGKPALAMAIARLLKKGKIIRLYRDFYIIVPAEYKKIGLLPPTWFIDPLIQFMGLGDSYYVGLLSAATLFGAAHQKVQTFQVLVPKTIRHIVHNALGITFINKKQIDKIPTTKLKTETGYIKVSTPEATALDLVQYMGSCGSLGNIATILSELAEILDARKLLDTAIKAEYDTTVIQRLGYILDNLGAHYLLDGLKNLVKERHPKYTKLRPDLQKGLSLKNVDWHIIENDIIEVDT